MQMVLPCERDRAEHLTGDLGCVNGRLGAPRLGDLRGQRGVGVVRRFRGHSPSREDARGGDLDVAVGERYRDRRKAPIGRPNCSRAQA